MCFDNRRPRRMVFGPRGSVLLALLALLARALQVPSHIAVAAALRRIRQRRRGMPRGVPPPPSPPPLPASAAAAAAASAFTPTSLTSQRISAETHYSPTWTDYHAGKPPAPTVADHNLNLPQSEHIRQALDQVIKHASTAHPDAFKRHHGPRHGMSMTHSTIKPKSLTISTSEHASAAHLPTSHPESFQQKQQKLRSVGWTEYSGSKAAAVQVSTDAVAAARVDDKTNTLVAAPIIVDTSGKSGGSSDLAASAESFTHFATNVIPSSRHVIQDEVQPPEDTDVTGVRDSPTTSAVPIVFAIVSLSACVCAVVSLFVL